MDLDTLRKKIDEIDLQVLELLNERVRTAAEIGHVKRLEGSPIYVASREEQVLSKLGKLNKGPLKDEAIRAIYREIMSAAIALEKPMRIAYLGPEATYTHQAANKKFGASIEYIPAPAIPDVFHMVSKGEADHGVIPIENSTEGAVSHSMDMFFESDLKICAQIFMPISHCLISQSPVEAIERVYSKDQAIGQCRKWLHAHLSNASLHTCDSTTQAVQVAKKDPKAAAIASVLASDLYGVPVVKEGIQDRSDNTTRFLVIAKESSGYVEGVAFKSSFLLSIDDSVGALERALHVFSSRNLNLSKIESRPNGKTAWEYSFFVDVIGHYEQDTIAEAIEELRGFCPFVKWLGSYPNVK
ncbi:prephenate dehydratase [Pelagicoccus sp. SDUM812003]|uniref:prephenate dehydratase n=1 Tax=Pelagicoccus sp. SDUM812003 TaxID=3041267 RepID=UPI00280DC01E|nr:prephenate dehydratase [Pelagicoccus sp. SDUM812003]MDQ8205153.1 prephenate dehydratase [Pelagicoccus sp. SDUM812003]